MRDVFLTGKAQTNTVDLGTGDSLSVSTGTGLTMRSVPTMLGNPAKVILKDDKGVCEMPIEFGMPEPVPAEDKLKEQMQASAQPMVANSTEGKLEIKKIESASFTLLYFELTDKREDAGDGRFMLQELGTSGKYLCQFMMLTNQKSLDVKTAILKSLGSMKIVPKK